MYKVLLVDDETLVKLGVRSILDWSQEGFEIVGEASGGREGVEAAMTLLPDLIISDIAMPEMDGLEMYEEIKKNGIHPIFVALSSYDQFELVKRALRAGAKDYLLKLNINKDSLHELLQGVKQELDNRALSTGIGSAGMSPKQEEELRRLYFYNLILGEETVAQKSDWFKDGRSARVCYIATDSWRILEQKTEMDKKIYGKTIRSLITEICTEFTENYCIDWGNGVFVTVLADDGKCSKEELMQMASAVMNSLDNYGNLQSSIGFSDIATAPSEIKNAFQVARQIRSALRYQGYGQIKFYETLEKEQDELRDQSESLVNLEKIISLCETMAFSDFSNYVSGFNYQIRSQKLSLENAAFQSAKMICVMEEQLHSTWSEKEIPTDAGRILQRIYRAETVDEIVKCNKEYCVQVELFFRSCGSGDPGRLIRDAKQYIKDHITEAISLKDVAAAMDVSPGYLSTAFSHSEDIAITNYINKKKVQKAQYLLTKERLKVYEVSLMLGFDNAGYFAKVFKKYSGCTPKQFLEGKAE